jgi:hypothetical protein
MELWVGCVAGALEESEFKALLAEVGFEGAHIEPTRVYKSEDARLFLAEAGIDVDASLDAIDGKFMAGFVRATKPGAPPAPAAPRSPRTLAVASTASVADVGSRGCVLRPRLLHLTAVAVATFGIGSGEALAAGVGPLARWPRSWGSSASRSGRGAAPLRARRPPPSPADPGGPTMRYALLSDVHANIFALEAVLGDLGARPGVAPYHLGDWWATARGPTRSWRRS